MQHLADLPAVRLTTYHPPVTPDTPHEPTRCGTVALVGKPNAGKSTLLNALVGERLAIVSRKPQATRLPVVGIRTEGDTQLVFLDQPGLFDPRYLMHEAMRATALQSIRTADAVLLLAPAGDDEPGGVGDLDPALARLDRPVATVRTMADRHPDPGAIPSGPDTFVVSAKTGAGLEALLAWCHDHVPPGPFRFDPDQLSVQPLRFFVAEFVREAAFELLGDELPYALAAEVDEFREGSTPLYIRVNVFVERATQKGMVIGKGGRMIKALGAAARKKIEALTGEPVYLDLWIKVLPKWRSNERALGRFGLKTPGEKPS